MPHLRVVLGVLLVTALLMRPGATAAQDAAPDPWQGIFGAADPSQPPAAAAPEPPPPEPEAAPNVTDLSRNPGESSDPDKPVALRLIALLTADGQQIDQGLIWRVYRGEIAAGSQAELLSTHKEPTPTVKLAPGAYLINAAFGRAHLTRRIIVATGGPGIEQFVLNAGGLRLNAKAGAAALPANMVTYSILNDERDQFDNRSVVMTGAKPGIIVRLNAGIYEIESRYGDANALAKADITVEAGKLTEVDISHEAATVTLKLVTRTGGEALADTQWSVQTAQGEVVKESVGALPSHILSPGSYVVTAKSGGRAFKREFSVTNGEAAQIEVLIE